MKRILALALLSLVALPALAQDPKVGGTTQTIKGNVTGASASQTVALVVTSKVHDGDWLERLVVRGADGKVLWQSPVARSMDDPNAFVFGNAGVARLQVAGDVDGDGKGEVVVEEPQSDVRPPHFRVLRWNGTALVKVRSQSLSETPKGSGQYVWTSSPSASGRWIHSFKRVVSPGVCVVDVLSANGTDQKQITVKSTARGYAQQK